MRHTAAIPVTAADLLNDARTQTQRAGAARTPAVRTAWLELAHHYTTLAGLLGRAPVPPRDIDAAVWSLRQAERALRRMWWRRQEARVTRARLHLGLARAQITIARAAGTLAGRHPGGSRRAV